MLPRTVLLSENVIVDVSAVHTSIVFYCLGGYQYLHLYCDPKKLQNYFCQIFTNCENFWQKDGKEDTLI